MSQRPWAPGAIQRSEVTRTPQAPPKQESITRQAATQQWGYSRSIFSKGPHHLHDTSKVNFSFPPCDCVRPACLSQEDAFCNKEKLIQMPLGFGPGDSAQLGTKPGL